MDFKFKKRDKVCINYGKILTDVLKTVDFLLILLICRKND